MEISVSNNDNVSREPASVGFTVTPKPLYWSSSGVRSARKEVGAAGEAVVNGTLGVSTIYPRDNLKFKQPQMMTSGLDDCTAEGTYTVDIVPADKPDCIDPRRRYRKRCDGFGRYRHSRA